MLSSFSLSLYPDLDISFNYTITREVNLRTICKHSNCWSKSLQNTTVLTKRQSSQVVEQHQTHSKKLQWKDHLLHVVQAYNYIILESTSSCMAVIHISQLTYILGQLERKNHTHLEGVQKNQLKEYQKPAPLTVKTAKSPMQVGKKN